MTRRSGIRVGVMAALLVAGLCVGTVLSLGTGSVSIPAGQTARVLASELPRFGDGIDTSDVSAGHRDIILRIRPPRVAVAVLVGMALALAGTIMQGYFQNPMADPYLIGVSAGAAFGATLALALRLDVWILGVNAVSLFAFVGALTVTFTVYTLARRGGRVPTGTLLLTGIAVGSLVSGMTSFVLIYGSEDLRPVVQWLMGNLSARQWSHVWMIAPYVALGLPLAMLYARDLNALLAGDEPAMHMGVDVERTRTVLLAISAILAAASVAAAGVIGFVGLVVPHIMRLIVGPDHRRLLPMSALGGALLVVLADIASRVVGPFEEIPVGIVTTLLGCPFFLYLLRRSRV